jgi:hypothetical protein
MDNKTKPSQIYTKQPVNDQRNEDNTTNDEAGHNQNWGEKCASTKLLHISEMVF